jgi:hypothetical protein
MEWSRTCFASVYMFSRGSSDLKTHYISILDKLTFLHTAVPDISNKIIRSQACLCLLRVVEAQVTTRERECLILLQEVHN